MNDAMRRTTTFAISVLLLYATATGSPTPTATPCIGKYLIFPIEDSCVPGETDIGNHGDDTVTTIALPFPYTLYDHTFNSINLSSNGNAQFTTTDNAGTNVCLPWLSHNFTIFPYWADQRTDANPGCSAYPGGTCGIYTSVSGIAPHRILNIEWRAVYNNNTSQHANHELRLYEGQSRFDVIYCTVDQGNTSATAGVQRDNTFFAQYFCNGSGGGATGGQSYVYFPRPCPSPTPRRLPPTPRPRPTPLPRPGSAHVDDEQVSLVAVPAGTHHYGSASNAERTIPAFDAGRPIKP